MANGGTTLEIRADIRQLDTAIKKIEGSITGLSSKLSTGFRLIDVRIDSMRRKFAEFEAQTEKSGNTISSALKSLGATFEIGALEGGGKKLAELTQESARLGNEFDRLFNKSPQDLLEAFKALQSQIDTLRMAADEGLIGAGIARDVAALTAKQIQIAEALAKQASTPFNGLQNLASFDGTIPDTPAARKLLKDFEEIRNLLQQIKTITSDPGIRSLIDNSLTLQRLPRQRGGLGAPAAGSGRTQLASSEGGGPTIAGETAALGEAEDSLSSAIERSSQALNEQTIAIGRLDTATRDLGFTFASAFEDAVVEGRRLSDVIEGLERDILRILTRKLVTEPLAGAVTGALGTLAGEFHAGGTVGATPVSGRVVPASLFAGAPRFAAGGLVARVPRLAPGEVPAILHRGEVVRTAAQEAALRGNASGPGETRIVVNIQTPDLRAFNESRGQIQAMLADAVRAGRRFR